MALTKLLHDLTNIAGTGLNELMKTVYLLGRTISALRNTNLVWIYTTFTQHLHNIYTTFTQHLHNIYTRLVLLNSQDLHKIYTRFTQRH